MQFKSPLLPNKLYNVIVQKNGLIVYCCKIEEIHKYLFQNNLNPLNNLEEITSRSFLSNSAKKAFIVGRFLIRDYLLHNLKISKSLLNFQYNKFGKPYLENYDVHFNISHSGKYIAIAFSTTPVGIDIEYINPNLNWKGILPLITLDNQVNLFQNNIDITEFFRLWTRKEAYLKMCGTGLSDEYLAKISLNLKTRAIQTYCLNGYMLSVSRLKKPRSKSCRENFSP